jgi:small subunit ribosomal protein S21
MRAFRTGAADVLRLKINDSADRGAANDRGPVPRRTLFYWIDRSKDGFMQIIVRDNNVDQALRALKKKLQREGVYREMKLRRHYEKPSEKRARERAAAVRRARKLERKRLERDSAR